MASSSHGTFVKSIQTAQEQLHTASLNTSLSLDLDYQVHLLTLKAKIRAYRVM